MIGKVHIFRIKHRRLADAALQYGGFEIIDHDFVRHAAECVKGMGAKYAILVNADPLKPVYYVLSDQLSGAKFSGKKVQVEGSLDAKNILQVTSIAEAK